MMSAMSCLLSSPSENSHFRASVRALVMKSSSDSSLRWRYCMRWSLWILKFTLILRWFSKNLYSSSISCFSASVRPLAFRRRRPSSPMPRQNLQAFAAASVMPSSSIYRFSFCLYKLNASPRSLLDRSILGIWDAMVWQWCWQLQLAVLVCRSRCDRVSIHQSSSQNGWFWPRGLGCLHWLPLDRGTARCRQVTASSLPAIASWQFGVGSRDFTAIYWRFLRASSPSACCSTAGSHTGVILSFRCHHDVFWSCLMWCFTTQGRLKLLLCYCSIMGYILTTPTSCLLPGRKLVEVVLGAPDLALSKTIQIQVHYSKWISQQ